VVVCHFFGTDRAFTRILQLEIVLKTAFCKRQRHLPQSANVSSAQQQASRSFDRIASRSQSFMGLAWVFIFKRWIPKFATADSVKRQGSIMMWEWWRQGQMP